MKHVNCEINRKPIQVKEGLSILEACRENHINIPTLCHLEGCEVKGACRICVVEVEGKKDTNPTCHSIYYSNQNGRTYSSCPDLSGEKQAEVSDSAFTQTFVQQCQEEAEDADIEGKMVGKVTLY